MTHLAGSLMKSPTQRTLVLAIASLYGLPSLANEPDAMNPAKVDDTYLATTVIPTENDANHRIEVTGKRLERARNQLMTETGSTVYRFDANDVAALPLGDATPLNQVLLQAPGVVQDSYGQLHVRGDHANLQYRIDGVIIPEPMTGFGQALSTQLAGQINVLTGALPAEYGYRTAGVVDIHTKGTDIASGGELGVVTGTDHYAQTSLNYGGSTGAWNYFLSGSIVQDKLGIENPTSARHALHDETLQANGFGYLSHVFENSRVSFLFGTSNNRFQIPDVPGQQPTYTIANTPAAESASLDAHQNEQNQFQVLSYQSSPYDTLDYQIALLHRTTSVHYYPDPVGDLTFSGVGATIARQLETTGVQTDWAYKLSPAHTLRTGLLIERERFSDSNQSSVFLTDTAGNVVSDIPVVIGDAASLSGGNYGAYLQDEWQATQHLVINYGARFDKTTTVTGEHQFSPRFGLVYDFSPDTRIHAGYARYFTPPPTEIIGTTSLVKFQNTTNALPTDADTAVKAERSHYFDAGLSEKLTADLTLGLDAYYRKVTNLQDEGQFGNALVYSAFNYAEGRVKGLELSLSYKHANWSAYANVARSQAMGKHIVTGQYNFAPENLAYIANNWIHLDHDQKLAASAGASYKWGPYTLAGDLIYGSGLRSGFANTDHLPAYTQVNMSLDRATMVDRLGKLNIRVAAINLFDKVYEIRDGTGVGVGAPQFGPRRGVFLELDQHF